jgi:dihydroneopterin aldolase/2-amino-4-hydroxy-6-hydroxymethyldihydropteridine diphosphokinase/dihydropteroate synthase
MLPGYLHPVLKKTVYELLANVVPNLSQMIKVMPFPATTSLDTPVPASYSIRPTATRWAFPAARRASQSSSPSRKTRIMATLNATPDSFSDGSTNDTTPAALSYTMASVAAGADIVDVGGYSTRPGAAVVAPSEEIARITPVIAAIRASDSEYVRAAPVSIDTFRADVARAALAAGANCINDVYAFTGPGWPLTRASARSFVEMRTVARAAAVPVVMMHSRGPAGEHKGYGAYVSVPDGVARELGEKVDALVRGPGGLRRWLVIVDPGVGFSKTPEGNLDVLRAAAALTSETLCDGSRNPLAGFPQLIGASRKSFLGKILEEPDEGGAYGGRETAPRERGWATAAAIACAVQQGVEVVRVHDALEMGDVVRVADRMWK